METCINTSRKLYSDEIARVIARLYQDVKDRQEEEYRKDVESGVSEFNAGMKAYPKTRAKLDVLTELMQRLDAEFPDMNTNLIMSEEGIEEV